MKLNRRQFNRLVRNGWEEILSETGGLSSGKDLYKKSKKSSSRLDLCAALLIVVLFGTLLIGSPEDQSGFDVNDMSFSALEESVIKLIGN